MTEAANIHEQACGSNAASHAARAPRPIAELEAQITELAGHLNAASYRWLVLIAEFDRREGWADGSTPSCAHWLGWKCGIDAGAAREKVRVARALEALPLISAAMARGALSYSKVRALTRVATPETEDTLLMIALHGTANHVETLVRRYRRAQEACELDREAIQYANRGLDWYYDDDGSLVLRARLTAETGALLVKALEQATEDGAPAPAWPDVSAETPEASERPGSSETLSQRRADALARFAETWLSHGDRSLGADRHQIVIHVDSETLRHDAQGRCEIESGPSLAAQTARRLSCDASVVHLVEDESGRPLDVGRKMRSIPPAIRRALRTRDPCCRFPGCTHTRFLDGHHIRHWAHGGETKLSNLVMLCRFHHRQVHEGRIDVQMLDDGALRFVGRQGQRLEAAVELAGDAARLVGDHRIHGIDIDETTAVSRWCGERLDYGIAVEGLLLQQEWARRDVSAETSKPRADLSAA
ncbi:MAG TPA: DUF222 domain-containing protein [Burkholderiaceae bacterium]|jgi:hypothetical protein|nr:DUF222 domain-containing protein [Burkholderiaceae bacterium]